MVESDHSREVSLTLECRAFTQYLIGRPPDAYVIRKYCDAHRMAAIIRQNLDDAFDTFLLRFALHGLYCTHLADVYTRWFYRRSVLRRKLLLLLAIFECTPQSFTIFESESGCSKVRFWAATAYRMGVFCCCFLASLVLFTAAYPIVKWIPALSPSWPEREQWERL